MMKKRGLILCLLLMLSVILVACNFGGEESSSDNDSGTNSESEESTTETASKKVINVAFLSDPPNLHPQLTTDNASSEVLYNVMEGLMTFKGNELIPGAAESYEISEDGLTYTFKLRDAKWTTGDPVTAYDFEYAWKFALNPENASEYASMLYPIKGAKNYHEGTGSEADVALKVTDDKTLEVTLENPTTYFLEVTAFKTLLPIHKATAEANPEWYTEAGEQFVSNGAFKLTEWVHGGSMKLEKNESYWDAANVALDEVNIAMVESEATAMTMYDANEIDFLGKPLNQIPLDALDRLNKEGVLKPAKQLSLYEYKMNTTDEIMKNVNIRKALALAIDRETLVKNITKGGEVPALDFIPAAIPGFEDDRGYFKDNDVEGAKKALEQGLKELGLSDPSELNIKLNFNTSDAHSAIAQYVQEEWKKKLGINVTLENQEWQVHLETMRTMDYQLARLTWGADYRDGYTFLERYDTVANGNNQTGWENAEYKKLLDEAQVEADVEKRTALLKQAEAILATEFPAIPVYEAANAYVVKDYVKNMEPTDLGYVFFKYVDINK